MNQKEEGMITLDNIINVRFKTSMIKSDLFDCSDACILVKETITVPNAAAAGAAVNNTNKKWIFKSCAPFTDCITEINNIQTGNSGTKKCWNNGSIKK